METLVARLSVRLTLCSVAVRMFEHLAHVFRSHWCHFLWVPLKKLSVEKSDPLVSNLEHVTPANLPSKVYQKITVY